MCTITEGAKKNNNGGKICNLGLTLSRCALEHDSIRVNTTSTRLVC